MNLCPFSDLPVTLTDRHVQAHAARTLQSRSVTLSGRAGWCWNMCMPGQTVFGGSRCLWARLRCCCAAVHGNRGGVRRASEAHCIANNPSRHTGRSSSALTLAACSPRQTPRPRSARCQPRSAGGQEIGGGIGSGVLYDNSVGGCYLPVWQGLPAGLGRGSLQSRQAGHLVTIGWPSGPMRTGV